MDTTSYWIDSAPLPRFPKLDTDLKVDVTISGKTEKKELQLLEHDAKLANEFGFSASFLEQVPFINRPGVKFGNQAKFHPRKYLAGLLKAIEGRGSHIFENTEADEVQEKPMALKVGKNKIQCRYLILATHTPLMGKTGIVSATLFQSKLFLYTSYVAGARLPKNLVPEASFWDTADPYYYLRIDQQR